MSPKDAEKRPRPEEYDPFFAGYVARVPPGDILTHLRSQYHETLSLLSSLPDARADISYAPGKWSIKQVVGHISDVERVMAYRALWFARNHQSPLPGFDENVFAAEGGFTDRLLSDLLDEFRIVREASVNLFTCLPRQHFARGGEANGHYVSVRALAYIIAGHELHHRAILQERYLSH